LDVQQTQPLDLRVVCATKAQTRPSRGPPGPNVIKNSRVTLHFVMPGIKALNNITLQFMVYKKSVHGVIFILLSFSE
jgi:hypothetical protein